MPLRSKQAEGMAKAFAKEMKKLPQQMKLTLTYDQGREMASHTLFTRMNRHQSLFRASEKPFWSEARMKIPKWSYQTVFP